MSLGSVVFFFLSSFTGCQKETRTPAARARVCKRSVLNSASSAWSRRHGSARILSCACYFGSRSPLHRSSCQLLLLSTELILTVTHIQTSPVWGSHRFWDVTEEVKGRICFISIVFFSFFFFPSTPFLLVFLCVCRKAKRSRVEDERAGAVGNPPPPRSAVLLLKCSAVRSSKQRSCSFKR